MAVHKIKLVFFLASIISASTSKLPEFIKPCSRRDPELNECLKQSLQNNLNHVIEGYPELNIPRLDPLLISEALITIGDAITLKGENVTVHGLRTTNIKEVKLNVEKQHMIITATVDKINADAYFKVKGNMLGLEFNEKGHVGVILDDVSFKFDAYYIMNKKNDEEHMKIVTSKVNYDFTFNSVKVDNLFGINNFINREVEQFVHDNYDDLVNLFKPEFEKIIDSVTRSYFNIVNKQIAFNDLVSE